MIKGKARNELNEEIFYLRKEGWSYWLISEYLGISFEQARDTVNVILDAEVGLIR